MAVRQFNGTTDQLVVSAGTMGAFVNGAHMIYAVVKYASISTTGAMGITGVQNTTSSLLASIADTGSGNVSYYSDGGTPGVWENLQANTWYKLALTKVAGTNAPRAHASVVGSGTWSHDDTNSTIADAATVCNWIEFGSFSLFGVGFFKDCKIATIGFAKSAPSDAAIQAIASTQDLANLGAAELFDFNQASTATAVASLTGTSTQSSLNGTTAVTGDDPSGWTFGVAAAPTSIVSPLRVQGPSYAAHRAASI